jgi:hypothetical protein
MYTNWYTIGSMVLATGMLREGIIGERKQSETPAVSLLGRGAGNETLVLEKKTYRKSDGREKMTAKAFGGLPI